MEIVPKGSDFIEKKKKISFKNACDTPLLYVLSPPSCSRRTSDSGAAIDYSKPPAGATRTAAGGFALAGVTQEREAGHYMRERSSWALLRSDLPWMGAPKE